MAGEGLFLVGHQAGTSSYSTFVPVHLDRPAAEDLHVIIHNPTPPPTEPEQPSRPLQERSWEHVLLNTLLIGTGLAELAGSAYLSGGSQKAPIDIVEIILIIAGIVSVIFGTDNMRKYFSIHPVHNIHP